MYYLFRSHDSFYYFDTAHTQIYTLSLHDALPISSLGVAAAYLEPGARREPMYHTPEASRRARGAELWATLKSDRKSTRLNSSHQIISYAVFCLKKKIEKRQRKYLLLIILLLASHF